MRKAQKALIINFPEVYVRSMMFGKMINMLLSCTFQVVVSLMEDAKPMRVRAALSRDGVEVYGDHVNMNPEETRAILLQVILIHKADNNGR